MYYILYFLVLNYFYAVVIIHFEQRPENDISNVNCHKSWMLCSTDLSLVSF